MKRSNRRESSLAILPVNYAGALILMIRITKNKTPKLRKRDYFHSQPQFRKARMAVSNPVSFIPLAALLPCCLFTTLRFTFASTCISLVFGFYITKTIPITTIPLVKRT